MFVWCGVYRFSIRELPYKKSVCMYWCIFVHSNFLSSHLMLLLMEYIVIWDSYPFPFHTTRVPSKWLLCINSKSLSCKIDQNRENAKAHWWKNGAGKEMDLVMNLNKCEGKWHRLITGINHIFLTAWGYGLSILLCR